MAIQFDAALRHGHRWPWRYEWRALLLLADGFLHFALVVDFDILMGYALVAMVVAPLLLLRTRWLALATVLLGAFHLAMQFRDAWSNSSFGIDSEGRLTGVMDGERFTNDLGAPTGDMSFGPATYFGEVTDRLNNFWDYWTEAFITAPPLSACLFLVGALLWRAGLFKADRRALRLSVWLAVGGLGVGVPLMLWPEFGLPGVDTLIALQRYTIAPLVACGYLGLVLILLRRGGGRGFLSRQLAAVGRTALSCYMLQNIIALVVFRTWGIGVGPLDSAGTIVAWAVISAILMLAASLWLRRFPQGPFEWVWKAAVDAPFRRRDRRRASEPDLRRSEPVEVKHESQQSSAPTGAP